MKKSKNIIKCFYHQIAALKRGESMQQGISSEHDFYKWVKEVNQVDRELKQIKKKCVKQLKEWYNTVSEEVIVKNSILYKDHHFWVPESIITKLLWLTHNESLSDHQEWNWIRNQIKFYYYWPTLYHNIDYYTFNCIACKHVKALWQRPADLLHPFEISQKHWQDLFCNFITDLPESENMNTIFIVIDKFLKKQHYILCCTEDKWISSKKTVWLFICEMFHYYGLSQFIVSD